MMLNNQMLADGLHYKLRRTIIEVLEQYSQGVTQHTLVNTLGDLVIFRGSGEDQTFEGAVSQMLQTLYKERIVYVDECPTQGEGQHRWHLKNLGTSVMIFDAARYLPVFVLGLDHFLVREGYPFIHQHTLVRRLALYIEEEHVDAVYQLALHRQWVQRQEASEMQRPDEGHRWSVWIADEQEEVQAALLNRNLMLDILYKKGKVQRLTRDAFKSLLKMDKRCTLKQDEIDEWITTFQRNDLLLARPEQCSSKPDSIQLNLSSHLVRRLLGRMYICGVVLALRILGATHPDRKKSLQEAVTFMTKIATHGNQELAGWAIEYAKSIRLVEYSKSSTLDGDIDVIHMKRHRVVYNLDQRETTLCHTLIKLVGNLSQHRSQDGWVARPVVLQAMEGDSSFGHFQGEHEYWINQAVHRHFLDRRVEHLDGRPPQNYLCVNVNVQL